MSIPRRIRSVPVALIIGFLLFVSVIAVLLAASLAPRSSREFAPRPIEPRTAPESLVVDTVTIEAHDPESWVYLDLATRSVHRRPNHLPWDLAFRRFHIITSGAAVDLGPILFDSLAEAPPTGYRSTVPGREPVNPALHRWYTYGFLSHVLSPNGHIVALRSRDGKYAKIEFLGYYCTGSVPACVTLRYAFQGDGSRRF